MTSNNIYTPDLWTIIEINNGMDGKIHHRVLASWYGGFAGADSWKLSSGIDDVFDDDSFFTLPQVSGTIYNCRKSGYGMSSLAGSIYISLQEKLAAQKTGWIKALSEKEALSYLKAMEYGK
jgi:hypothetical protein